MRNLINVENEFARMRNHFSKVLTEMGVDDDLNFSFKQPECDVYETSDKVVCKFDVPGVDKSEIKLSVEEGFVILKAEKDVTKKDFDKDRKSHRFERSYTGFYRKIMLPHAVDEEDVDAKFENGTLKVELKKVEVEHKSKKLIEIK